MVCAKSEANLDSLFVSFSRRSRCSVLVNLVGSLLDRYDRVSSMVIESFRIHVGNGSHFDFWVEN